MNPLISCIGVLALLLTVIPVSIAIAETHEPGGASWRDPGPAAPALALDPRLERIADQLRASGFRLLTDRDLVLAIGSVRASSPSLKPALARVLAPCFTGRTAIRYIGAKGAQGLVTLEPRVRGLPAIEAALGAILDAQPYDTFVQIRTFVLLPGAKEIVTINTPPGVRIRDQFADLRCMVGGVRNREPGASPRPAASPRPTAGPRGASAR